MRSVRTSTPLITITRTPSRNMPLYAVAPRRNMHYNPFAPVFGYNHCVPSRVTPSHVPSLFRSLEEDFASMDNLFNSLTSSTRPAIRSFQPRFDVREENDAFHLTGEVPGVAPENLQVEFADRNTMVVRGRTVSESQRGNPPAAVEQQAPTSDKGKEKAVEGAPTPATNEDAMETELTSRPSTPASQSSNYHKATVEDSREEGDDFVDVAAENGTATEQPQEVSTTTEAPAATSNAASHQEPLAQQPQAAQKTNDEGHYWMSERSVGQFQRSFRFPGQVDQENVKASLKDGVLSVVVPKVKASGPRRIQIE